LGSLDEYDIVQNLALASAALLSFSIKYYETVSQTKGIQLPVLMLVLPLVFNESITDKIYKRHYKGGLYKSLNEDRAMFIGLQERMQDMSKLSLQSINVCLASNFLIYEKNDFTFIPTRTKINRFKEVESLKRIIAAADRLGHWFATIDFDELCRILKVRF